MDPARRRTASWSTIANAVFEYGLRGCTSRAAGLTLKNSTVRSSPRSGIVLKEASVAVDYCNVLNNGVGVFHRGSSGGTPSYSNEKYNDREGIMLLSGNLGHPAPTVSNDNVFGNSVKEGRFLDPINLSVSTDASYASGNKVSSIWSTPAGQSVMYGRFRYTESDSSSNYVSGSVRKDSASGGTPWSVSTATGPLFVDISGPEVTKLVAIVHDGSSYYYGTMTVEQVFYYVSNEPTIVKPIELSAATYSGKVDCRNNYWGVFQEPTPRFNLARADAIDFQGFVGVEINGTCPQ